jgi:prolipoprotein diacylglyceryltransferase
MIRRPGGVTNMQQVLFRIPIFGGIPIYGFGAMLFVAFLACIWLATRRAKKLGIAPEVIQDLALWIFGGGILGGRICYLILHDMREGKIQNVGEFFKTLPMIWNGGLIFYGAVIGAILSYFVGWYVSFRHKQNVTTLRLADVIAPTVAVGLLFGRVGCLLNGCCFGQVACASCPAITFPISAPAHAELVGAHYQTPAGFLLQPPTRTVSHVEPGSAADRAGLKPGDTVLSVNGVEVRDAAEVSNALGANWPRGQSDLTLTVDRKDEKETLTFVPRSLGLQPTQPYETISMILVLLLLLAFDSIKTREGQVMALMMICYGAHRYVNEILRSDHRPVGFESYVSLLMIGSGVLMLLLVWKFTPSIKPAPTS